MRWQVKSFSNTVNGSPRGVALKNFDGFVFIEIHPKLGFLLGEIESYSIKFLAFILGNTENVEGSGLEGLKLVNG